MDTLVAGTYIFLVKFCMWTHERGLYGQRPYKFIKLICIEILKNVLLRIFNEYEKKVMDNR